MQTDQSTCAQPVLPPAALRLPVVFRPSAGNYLRMRREAAGLSIDDVAIATNLDAASIEAAEKDEAVWGDHSVGVYSRAVRLDRAIYANLRDDLPASPVCAGCACSWFDPCQDGHQGCSWVDGGATLCSACAAKVML